MQLPPVPLLRDVMAAVETIYGQGEGDILLIQNDAPGSGWGFYELTQWANVHFLVVEVNEALPRMDIPREDEPLKHRCHPVADLVFYTNDLTKAVEIGNHLRDVAPEHIPFMLELYRTVNLR